MIYWLIIGSILLVFGLVVFRGAPYVPTHRRKLRSALELLRLNSNDVIVDLGSGDGYLLKIAAKQGLRAVGYEINPFLCLIAWLRCLPQHSLVTIKLRDFWLTDLPPETKAVFIFLAGPYMRHLAKKLEEEMSSRRRPLKIISYGYAIPGYLPKNFVDGLYLYELSPNAKMDMALQTEA
jgi:hypothetical protein